MRLCLLLLTTCLLTAADGIRVIATVPVIADLARQVAGGRAVVECLVPAGAELHDWSPAVADVQRISGATLVVANGLGLEPWLPGLLGHAGWKGGVVQAAGDATAGDPHAWHDVKRAMDYVRRIRDGLMAADPAGAESYQARSDLALSQLAALDAWVRRQVARIPPARRILVTPHAGLASYATAYGFILAAVEGDGHGHEPDAQHVGELVQLIRGKGLPAVFAEGGHDGGVLVTIAREAGVRIAGPLAADGPAAGQGYVDMVAANTLLIVDALR